ncbi:MAG: beta-lactamase family protein [Gemmatimonadaceae bacterium]|nr:beta-lactamase family protein [Gemmatimonadaceae bacterium]
MRHLALGAALTCAPSVLSAQGGPPHERDVQTISASPMSQDELVRALKSLGDSLTRLERFSGVVLLARNGVPVATESYGYADREAKRRNTPATTFNVSSIGKLFTMLAAAQLVTDGTLAMDGTIARYWPDYPDAAAASKITIRQLLEHRSGIDGDIFVNPSARRSNRDALALVTNQPLAFEPGTRQQYSNAGYVVLGEIIARVSGETYEDYIRRHVLAPAGMAATGFPSNDSLPPNTAIGYTRGLDDDQPLPSPLPPLARNTGVQPRRGSAAGGSYSNVSDLLRFVLARRQGSLGAPPRREQTIAAGGSPGSNGIIAEGLPGGYDLIVLANFDPPAAGVILDAVESWLGGGRSGPDRVRVGGPPRGGAAGPDAPRAGGIVTTTLPETPVGRVASDYLKAFATGDTSVMRAFLLTRVVPGARSWDERVAQYREMYGENGALTLVDADAASDAEITMRVTGSRSGPLVVMLRIEPAAPFRIVGMQFRMER